MAYDEQLAARVRALLNGQHALVENKMFGGLAYMSQGKMLEGSPPTRLTSPCQHA
jgi:hypothetical protein